MSEPISSTELRDALFAAILQQQDDSLLALCQGYTSTIVECFSEWQKMPVDIRARPQAMEAYGHCLISLARLFEANGILDLMKRLTGGADNTIVRWQNAFMQASELAQGGNYEASTEILHVLSEQMQGTQGTAVDEYRPRVYGLLGTNSFYLGNRDDAIHFTRKALDDCRRCGDAAGVRAYTENLRVVSVAAAAGSKDKANVRLNRIRASLARAQDLSDDARYDQSNDLLDSVLNDIVAAADGSGSEYRGKALGLMGLNYFRLGDAARASEHTAAALVDCQSRDDGDGVRIYTCNLTSINKHISSR